MKITQHITVPFRAWIIDGFCPPIDLATLPPANSHVWEVCYANDVERGKRTTRRLASLPIALQSLFGMLRSTEQVELWRSITGARDLQDDPELWGGGLHLTEPGGFLQVHVDYDRHMRLPVLRRAMNLIAFLNPEWREEWGGALLFCRPDGRPAAKVYPRPGRLVAFETNDLSYHGVEQVSAACPVPRVSAAVYYLGVAHEGNVRTRALFLPNRGGIPAEVSLGVQAERAAHF